MSADANSQHEVTQLKAQLQSCQEWSQQAHLSIKRLEEQLEALRVALTFYAEGGDDLAAELRLDAEQIRRLCEQVDEMEAELENEKERADAWGRAYSARHKDAEAAEAELERVKAERDEETQHHVRTAIALDKALTALRVYATPTHWAIGRDDLRDRQAVWIGPGAIGELSGIPDPMDAARAAIAEIEGEAHVSE